MIQKVAKWKGRIARGVYPICYLCGQEIRSVRQLSQDHVVSKSRGGKTIDSNILIAHVSCNNRKGNMSIVEWFDKVNRERE